MEISFYDNTGKIVHSSIYTDESLVDFSKYSDFASIPQYGDPLTQYVLNGQIVNMPEKPDITHIFDFNSHTWMQDNQLLISDILLRRYSLLVASDFSQLPDVPIENKEAWSIYRQQLRDITEQPGYPTQVVWPVAPQ